MREFFAGRTGKWVMAAVALAVAVLLAFLLWPGLLEGEPPAADLQAAVEESVPEVKLDFPVSLDGYTVLRNYKTEKQGERWRVYHVEVRLRPEKSIIAEQRPILTYPLEVDFTKRGKEWHHTWSANTQGIAQQIAALKEKELIEEERRRVDARKAEDEKERVEAAQKERDQALAREEQAKAEKVRMDAELAQREVERATQERVAMQKSMEQAGKAAEEAKKVQVERAARAATLFSGISIALPSISESLKRVNLIVEFTGKDLEKVPKLQARIQKQEYLQLIGDLLEQTYTEYPPVEEIEKARARLGKLNLQIRARTQITEKPDSRLYLVWFPKNDRDGLVRCAAGWKRAPEGIGYLYDWLPVDGPTYMVGGNPRTVDKPIANASQYSREQIASLEKRKAAGEFDEASFQARAAELRKTNREKMVQWALSR